MRVIQAQRRPYIKWLAIWIGFNALDCALTLLALNQGHYEANGVMRLLLSHGVLPFVLFKIGFAGLVAGAIIRLSRRYPGQTYRISRILGVAMVAICLWNLIWVV
jgi:hypothetical protein